MTGAKAEELTLNVPGVDPEDHTTIANAINTNFVNIGNEIPDLDSANLPAYLLLPANSMPKVQPWHIYQELWKTKIGKAQVLIVSRPDCFGSLCWSLANLFLRSTVPKSRVLYLSSGNS